MPVDDMQIAVADAGGRGAHQHLAAPRLVDLDRLDRQRLMHLAENRGLDLHVVLPLTPSLPLRIPDVLRGPLI